MNEITRKWSVRRVMYGLLILAALIIIAAAVYLNSLLPIITGYAAKNLCSAVFVQQRDQEEVESTDLNFSFISLTSNSIDMEEKSVTSRFLWGKSKAIFRDRFGATLVRGVDIDELKSVYFPSGVEPGYSGDNIPWPMGEIVTDTLAGIDREKLGTITENLITENAYGGNAFAFIVMSNGIPVAESYKPQFTAETPFLSWSMAKSVTNAMVGVMNMERGLDIESDNLLPDWDGERRSQITINNLLQMQSGLGWNEDYGNRSDVTVMLHCEEDFARFAYTKDLAYEPGTHWYYSSGTANIVSWILREEFDNDNKYYAFPHTDLFYRIGITDAVFEPDASGTLVGSSYLYMTARDYARFALLYLQDGLFAGERVLPEGWVEYSVSATQASAGEYGSLFWLNRGDKVPSAPADMFMCIGHDGQRIFMIPSLDLAVVILGYSPDNSMDFNRLLKDIIATLPTG
ncbi:MAG: beta-lactamase family protein [Bacteroidales bacterium]|nr:beta-lactamase family protein [Bacteroidales bacterium]